MKLLLSLLLISSIGTPISCLRSDFFPCSVNAGETYGDLTVHRSGNDSLNIVQAVINQVTEQVHDITLYGKSDDNLNLFTFYPSDLENSYFTNFITNDLSHIDFVTVKGANGFNLFLIDDFKGFVHTDGLLTFDGNQSTISHVSFWQSEQHQIPEPMSLMLLLSGVFGLGMKRRRRRRS